MLLGARQFFAARKAAPSIPTARDYVQDGLVAMWDGMENAGWGVHDNSLAWSDWANLGSESVTSTYVIPAIGSNWEWSDLGPRLREGGNGSAEMIIFGVPIALANDFTLDYCTFGPTSSMRPFYCAMYGQGAMRFFLPGTSTGFYCGGTGRYSATQELVNASVVSVGGASMLGYYNGALNQSLSNTFERGTTTEMQLILLGSRQYSFAGSTMHCFRIYNRAISAAEIAANYAIDKARFNLP